MPTSNPLSITDSVTDIKPINYKGHCAIYVTVRNPLIRYNLLICMRRFLIGRGRVQSDGGGRRRAKARRHSGLAVDERQRLTNEDICKAMKNSARTCRKRETGTRLRTGAGQLTQPNPWIRGRALSQVSCWALVFDSRD